jgi:hypothetical protein
MEINCFGVDPSDIRVMTYDSRKRTVTGTVIEEFMFNEGDILNNVLGQKISLQVKDVRYEESKGRYVKPHKRFIITVN